MTNECMFSTAYVVLFGVDLAFFYVAEIRRQFNKVSLRILGFQIECNITALVRYKHSIHK